MNFATTKTTPICVPWTDRPTPVFHSCYLPGHYVPDCLSSALAEPEIEIGNYDMWNADDCLRVPDRLCRRSRLLIELETSEELKREVAHDQKT